MSAPRPPREPDPEAELEFARRAGRSERYVERMRRMQQQPREPAWIVVPRFMVYGLTTKVTFHSTRVRLGVPLAILLTVAVGSLLLAAEAAVRLLLRAHRRRRQGARDGAQ